MASLIDIIINATDRASKDIDRINEKLDNMARSGGKTTAIMAGLAGSVGALAPAVAGAMGLASAFGAAGIAVGAYGVVAGSVLKDTFNKTEEITKAEEKLAQADSAKERAQAQKELQAVLAGVSTEQQKAIASLNQFKGFWSGFTAQFEAPILNTFSVSLQALQTLFEKLQPTIMMISKGVEYMMNTFNNSLNTEGAMRFFQYLEATAGQVFYDMWNAVGNLAAGFGELLMAFEPLAMSMSGGLVDLTAKFRAWAASLSGNPAFQNFLNYVKTNAPLVLSTIGNLWNFIVKLVQALAPLGTVVLSVASSFTEWLSSSTTVQTVLDALSNAGKFLLQHLSELKIVLAGIVTGFLAFKAVTGIIAIVRTCVTVFNTLKTAITAIRTAWLFLNTAFLASPIGWVILIVLALVAVGILLYKNWDKIKAKAQELWSWMKSTWEKIKQAVVLAVTVLSAMAVAKFKDFMSKAKSTVQNGIDAVVKFFVNLGTKVKSTVDNIKQRVETGFKNMMNSAKNAIQSGISAVVNFFTQLGSKIASTVSSIASRLVSGFTSMMSQARSAVSSGVQNCISAITGFASTFLSAGKGLLDSFVSGIKSGISKAVGAVSEGMSKIRSFLPFSPAKKGALSDLDKSGESFFPTWYNGALKKVPAMTRAIGGAMGTMNDQLSTDSLGASLTSFTGGGRSSLVVTHVHEHSGEVTVKGDSNSETVQLVGQTVKTQTETDIMSGLRQAIRQK